jgi:HSP20 family protein
MAADDPRSWMWTEACALIDRAERLHRQFFQPGFSALQIIGWEPPVDVFETERELWIICALPGVEHQDLELSIEANTLRVAGLRRLPVAARSATIHRLEIPYGRFERRVPLPDGLDLGRSELEDGCLYVSLTKRPAYRLA